MASQKLSDLYYDLIQRPDPGQVELLDHFERLRGDLLGIKYSTSSRNDGESKHSLENEPHIRDLPYNGIEKRSRIMPPAAKDKPWARFISGMKSVFAKKSHEIKGIYLWGSVGRGKTCLMDLFYESMTLPQKRREHFHVFMQEIHARIKQIKSLDNVADEVASQVKLLCFDEFQVTNIADAMIMSRFFGRLIEKGVVIVMTSNVAPKDLYLNGLGREHFLPFIDLLSHHMETLKIEEGIDYRKENLKYAPSDLLSYWKDLTKGNEVEPLLLKKGLRSIEVKQSAGDYAWFTFDDLCAKPLGVRDYLLLSNHYKGIFVDPLPALTSAERNEAHRLMTLVDVLYERRIPLYYSGVVDPDQIYTQGEGAKAFERTASRLYEMRKWYTNGN